MFCLKIRAAKRYWPHFSATKPISESRILFPSRVKANLSLYSCCIMPMRVMSLQGPSLFEEMSQRQDSSFRRTFAAVATRWQLCIQFDRPEI